MCALTTSKFHSNAHYFPILKMALKIFFFIIPVWKAELVDECTVTELLLFMRNIAPKSVTNTIFQYVDDDIIKHNGSTSHPQILDYNYDGNIC